MYKNRIAVAIAREIAGFVWALMRQVPMAAWKETEKTWTAKNEPLGRLEIRIEARDAANVGRAHEESMASMALYAMTSGTRLKKACSRDG